MCPGLEQVQRISADVWGGDKYEIGVNKRHPGSEKVYENHGDESDEDHYHCYGSSAKRPSAVLLGTKLSLILVLVVLFV